MNGITNNPPDHIRIVYIVTDCYEQQLRRREMNLRQVRVLRLWVVDQWTDRCATKLLREIADYISRLTAFHGAGLWKRWSLGGA